MRGVSNLLAAVLFFITAVMVIGVFKDPFEPFKKLVTTSETEVTRHVEEEANPRFLALNIWHPSFGADSEATMALIGTTVRNYQKQSGKNLQTIFQHGLAEIPEERVRRGAELFRSITYVEWYEVSRYGRLEHAQAVAHKILKGTMTFSDEIARILNRCVLTKFVRARAGTLIKTTVSGGENELRTGIRKELGPPVLVSEGTEFYGHCS